MYVIISLRNFLLFFRNRTSKFEKKRGVGSISELKTTCEENDKKSERQFQGCQKIDSKRLVDFTLFANR